MRIKISLFWSLLSISIVLISLYSFLITFLGSRGVLFLGDFSRDKQYPLANHNQVHPTIEGIVSPYSKYSAKGFTNSLLFLLIYQIRLTLTVDFFVRNR